MKRGLIVLAALTTLLLAACGGAPKTPDTSASAQLTIDMPLAQERSYDTLQLGRLLEGDVVEGEIALRNNGSKPLVILQVITGCGCTTTDYDPAPIAPSTERIITYRFDTRGRLGDQSKSIEIITADRQVATLYLMAEVRKN